ncbi:MAG: hypothetical protein AAGB48_06000 [Planctomycetota bacterium]
MNRQRLSVGAAAVFAAVVGGDVSAQALVSSDAAPIASGTPVIEQAGPGTLLADPSKSLITSLEWTGTLNEGNNLAFAVINGDVRFTAPETRDLPLLVSGTLVANGPDPSFELSGSFASPTRAYTFDVFVDGFGDSLTVTESTIVVSEATDSLAFDLVIDRITGTGSFSYSETVLAGGVELERFAAGTIGAATPIPGPATAGLLLAGAGLASRRRRG